MTPTLELKIFDDKLLNRQQLIDFLANNKDSVNLILMVNEGASLHQCGAMDIIHESGLAKKIKLDTLTTFLTFSVSRKHSRISKSRSSFLSAVTHGREALADT